MGNEDARFVALQNSRNGESLLAGNMGGGRQNGPRQSRYGVGGAAGR